jgi:hypothetical protein
MTCGPREPHLSDEDDMSARPDFIHEHRLWYFPVPFCLPVPRFDWCRNHRSGQHVLEEMSVDALQVRRVEVPYDGPPQEFKAAVQTCFASKVVSSC